MGGADARKARRRRAREEKLRETEHAFAEAAKAIREAATETKATRARSKSPARSKRGDVDAVDASVEVEYVPAPLELELEGARADAEAYEAFSRVFEAFRARGSNADEAGTSAEGAVVDADAGRLDGAGKGVNGDAAADEDEGEAALSNKKKKELRRMKVAELKQHCTKPELVEVWDTSASDPRLLVFLKAYKNTVPVPRHWSQKRAFLQGKRGIEKPPWELPDFIRATGIQKIRDHYADKEGEKTMKQKQRDSKSARTNRMDIDYQILHDAFFVYQSKPKMSAPGDLYYEGKEYEVSISRKPGRLSEELKSALGMTEGGPPPWLINMQRYGPPPSYPHLRVPGLSAPLPPGAQFGYHPGGWGKPPVDELGVPIYGDVFGSSKPKTNDMTPYDVAVDKTKRFGEIDEDFEEEEEEEQEEEPEDVEEEEEREEDETGIESELPPGTETPDVLDLRKKSDGPKSLYTVLQSQDASVRADQIVGSSHTYVIPNEEEKSRRRTRGEVEVTLDADALGDDGVRDEEAMRAAYERTVAEKRAEKAHEDFSDMVADHARAQKRKAKDKKESDAKKFKF